VPPYLAIGGHFCSITLKPEYDYSNFVKTASLKLVERSYFDTEKGSKVLFIDKKHFYGA